MPGDYWERGEFRTPREAWVDPKPDICGMLAADMIEYYARQAKMIDPFCTGNLRPASYELRLGPRYQIDGKDRFLTPDHPTLTLPPNSIVFVSMRERLALPHYIAARFNLSIDLIYQGLLLGTGPQVDPGFQGVLSCPLHNISNREIHLDLGDTFAKIDFQKTTGLGRHSMRVLEAAFDEDVLYRNEDDIVGEEGFRNRLFSKNKRWRPPIKGYPPGLVPVSSSISASLDDLKGRVAAAENTVAETHNQITRTRNEVSRRLNQYGFAAVITLVVAVVGLGIASYQVLENAYAQFDDYRSQLSTTQVELAHTQEQLQRLLGGSPTPSGTRSQVTPIPGAVEPAGLDPYRGSQP